MVGLQYKGRRYALVCFACLGNSITPITEMPGVDQQKLDRLRAKASQVRTGGKGSVRRWKKTVSKSVGGDEKRLQGSYKKLGMSDIPGIEEVNMFKEDGSILHFKQPNVVAQVHGNTFAISGHSENKSLQDLLPDVIHQLGPDSVTQLKQIAETLKLMQQDQPAAAEAGEAAAEEPADFEATAKVD